MSDALAYEAVQNKVISLFSEIVFAQTQNTEILGIYIFPHQELDLISDSISMKMFEKLLNMFNYSYPFWKSHCPANGKDSHKLRKAMRGHHTL